MHRLEDGGGLADIGARRHAQPAYQAGDLVGQDVAEQVGTEQHVELPGIEHELHGAGIDDAIVHLHAARIVLRHLARGFQEDAGQRLQDIGLVHHGDLLALVLDRVLERKAGDAPAGVARIGAGGHGYRVRVIAHGDVVIVRHVEAAHVLAHQHQVDILEAARHQRARGPYVGEEVEGFAQPHVDRAEAAAHRRG